MTLIEFSYSHMEVPIMGFFGGGEKATATIDDSIEYEDPETGMTEKVDIHIDLAGENEEVEQAAADYKAGGGEAQMAACEDCDDNQQRQRQGPSV